MRSRKHLIALTAVFALGAVGCGGSSEGGSSRALAPDTAALETTTRDFAVKLLSGGADTYDYLSRECRDTLPEAEWNSKIAIAAAFMQAFSGDMGDAADLVGSVETRKITEKSGESRFDLVLPETTDGGTTAGQGGDWMKWIVEEGEWRVTDCEKALGTGSDSSGTSGDDPSSLAFDGAPTEIEIEPADMFTSPNTGTSTLRLTDVEEIASPIVSDSYGETPAKGRFFAVRYEVINNTDKALHQFFDVVTAIDATDGETWFEITDGAASDGLTLEREGDAATADVEAGATGAGWLVFDVPEDAEIVGLGYRPGFFETTALSLP